MQLLLRSGCQVAANSRRVKEGSTVTMSRWYILRTAKWLRGSHESIAPSLWQVTYGHTPYSVQSE